MRGAVPMLAAAVLASAPPDAGASGKPEVTGVEPGRDGGLLTCAVRTAHLPGERMRSSLESGLPSAIQMDLDVFDERDRIVAGNRVFLRVAFDLWEEVFRIEGPGGVRRFPDLPSLASFLERIPRLPVSPLGRLRTAGRHRIRVGMQLHPVAPRETERLGDWVAGGAGPRAERETDDPEGREVSISLGEIIRFFYKGAPRRGASSSVCFSAWFVPAELASGEPGHAADPE